MEYYFYNTDAKSFDGAGRERRVRTLINEGIAVTGGPREYGELLGRLDPNDILLMYENHVGIVAVGNVVQPWDQQEHRELLYYGTPDEVGDKSTHEFRIRVDWEFDLSNTPIAVREIIDRLGFIPRMTLFHVKSQRAEVEAMMLELRRSRDAQSGPGRSRNSVEPSPPDCPSVDKPPDRIECVITRIIRDTAEARRLKVDYEYKCQVCRERIEIGPDNFYAEVDHIRPLGGKHRGLDRRENMLVLCPTHHAMFDLGLVRFLSTTHVRIASETKELSAHEAHEIAEKSIRYHNSKLNRSTARSGTPEHSGKNRR